MLHDGIGTTVARRLDHDFVVRVMQQGPGPEAYFNRLGDGGEGVHDSLDIPERMPRRLTDLRPSQDRFIFEKQRR